MKVKSIINISSDVRYIIRVFKDDEFIEDFKIDYIDMSNEELTTVLCYKYFKYENNTVRHISTETRNGNSYLVISVNA